MRRCWRTGASRSVSFDDSYRDLPALTRLISGADLVVLPYDSDDQVTSGVLVDAVACGRPVVATAFPHAIELLSGGAGVVVPQRDAAALADVVRSVVDHPELLDQHGRRVPTVGARAVVAGGRPPLRRARHRRLLVAEAGERVNVPEPSFEHIVAMSDGIGTFEHADHSVPRVARGVLHRRHGQTARRRLSRATARRHGRRPRPDGVPVPRRRPGRRRQGPQPAVRRRSVAWSARRRGLLGPRHVGVRHGDAPGAGGLDAPERRIVVRPRAASNGRTGLGRCPSPRSARPRSSPSNRTTSARGDCWPTPSTRSARPADRPGVVVARSTADVRQRRPRRGAHRRRRAARPSRRARRRPRRLAVVAGPRDGRRPPVADRHRRSRTGRSAADVRPTTDRGGRDGRRLCARLRGHRRSRLARRRSTWRSDGSSAPTMWVSRWATSTAAPATTGSRPTASTATRAPSRRSR